MNLHQIVILPVVLPLFCAAMMLLFWKAAAAHRIINLIGSMLSLLVSGMLLAGVRAHGILTLAIGGWPAPFGVVMVADLFSALMVVITAVVAFATALYSMGSMDPGREKYLYYPLLQFLLMGINGAFLTGDIFNLYVWFEVMLIASFVLLALGGERGQIEGAIKYVTLNLLSSAIFLAAAGMLYGIAGTLNMADLARMIPALGQKQLLTVVAVLFMIAFGVKAAVFPLFFWLPASYHTPPAAVSAVFAGLLTKVGVYALIRFFTTIFVHDTGFTHTLLLASALLTMLTGVLGAAAQNDFRKILSFHIISQIGYMIMGLGIFTPMAIAGALYFMVHNMVAKTGTFLASGIIARLKGSYDLKEVGGLYRQNPLLAVLFIIPAFALAGVPPLSGFFAKFILIKAGIDAGQYLITAVALLTGMLTLYSMIKIWNEAFLKKDPGSGSPEIHDRLKPADYLPLALLALGSLLLGLLAAPVFRFFMEMARQLTDPACYIEAVMHNPNILL